MCEIAARCARAHQPWSPSHRPDGRSPRPPRAGHHVTAFRSLRDYPPGSTTRRYQPAASTAWRRSARGIGRQRPHSRHPSRMCQPAQMHSGNSDAPESGPRPRTACMVRRRRCPRRPDTQIHHPPWSHRPARRPRSALAVSVPSRSAQGWSAREAPRGRGRLERRERSPTSWPQPWRAGRGAWPSWGWGIAQADGVRAAGNLSASCSLFPGAGLVTLTSGADQ